jgi:hypothetical protein
MLDITSAGNEGTKKKKTGDSGLDTMDWVGIGLQLAGALSNQTQEERERKRQDLLTNNQNQLSLQLGNRNRMDTLQQNAVENQHTTRTQNMAGLNFMNNLVDSNQAAGRKKVPSFRDALIYGGGY